MIVLDREVQGDQYTCFIGADNVRIGREAGRWLGEALGGRGKIVELKGLMTSTPGQDRHQGFLEGLELDTHPGLQIVFSGEMQWLEPNARREMESALATQPASTRSTPTTTRARTARGWPRGRRSARTR